MTHHTTEAKVEYIEGFLKGKFDDFKPGVEPEQPEPGQPDNGYVKPGGWGASKDPNGYKVVNMRDKPELFKVVDAAGINVATEFKTKAGAEAFIAKAKAEYKPEEPGPGGELPPTEPLPPGSVDKVGLVMIRPTKAGGKEFYTTDFNYKRSTHNQSNKKNIPRDTFSKSGVNFFAGEYTMIAKVDARNIDDDYSFKIGSKNHSDSAPKEGQCYSLGISFGGGVHLSKETPQHPDTPNFDEKCKVVPGMPKSFGNISNKFVGIKGIVEVVDGGKNTAIEVWIDPDPLDAAGKPKNNFKKWWTAKDDGSWENKPQTDLCAKPAMIYIRIDEVGKKTEMPYISAREI